VEAGKKAFVGHELPGRTLGVIGLGAIGSMVADAAIRLGMNVIGYDPEITVDAAWRLPSQVRKAPASVEDLVKHCDFISLHTPLVPATRNLINAERVKLMRKGCVLLNFARDGIVNEQAVLDGLNDNVACLHLRFSEQSAEVASALRRLAASGRVDRGGGRELRRDGRRPTGRLSGTRQYPQCGEFPQCRTGARVGFPPGHRQCQRAQHAGPDIHFAGCRRTEYPQHGEQIEGDMAFTLVGVLTVRYLPAE
jgi:hypothetical protein